MDNSLGTGFMAVFAVSGSVVFLAMQAHKRLLSDFIKKMEFEIKNSTTGAGKNEGKKKVRFADDVAESTADHKGYGNKISFPTAASSCGRNKEENLEAMPLNWQVMYKGILKNKNLRVHN